MSLADKGDKILFIFKRFLYDWFYGHNQNPVKYQMELFVEIVISIKYFCKKWNPRSSTGFLIHLRVL